MVKAKDSTLMIKLVGLPEKKTIMQTRYRYYPEPTENEIEVKNEELAQRLFKEGDDINTGIVIFDKSDCSRCENATSYLLDNDIDFKWIPLPTNDQVRTQDMSDNLRSNRRLLSQKMQENGMFGSYTTPVIIIDGKLTHSHSNLTEFLTTIKGK